MERSFSAKRTIPGLALLVALTLLSSTPASAITWGGLDDTDGYPNVGVFKLSLTEGGEILGCSGTLIHPKVFLTAAHCTFFTELYLSLEIANGVWVSFDWDATSIGSTWLPVQMPNGVVTHPRYSGHGGATDRYDIGALILEIDPGIVPANLPKEGYLNDLRSEGLLRQGKDEADFTVVGYGMTLDFPPPQFNFDPRRRYAESEYQALLKAWLRMSQNQATGDGGTCYGDSGGPAFWFDPDAQKDFLVGITSWGDAVCVATGFNYRTDTATAITFIQGVIAAADGDD
jgi:hypothetical protein